MSLVKRLGNIDGIVSIKTQLKGAFGFSGFLDVAFLLISEIWHDVQKWAWVYYKLYILPNIIRIATQQWYGGSMT